MSHSQYSLVPVVSASITTSGIGVAGERYTINCSVNGTEFLRAEIVLILKHHGSIVTTGNSTSVVHHIPKLSQSDGGQYLCEASVESDLLLQSLNRTEILNVIVTG